MPSPGGLACDTSPRRGPSQGTFPRRGLPRDCPGFCLGSVRDSLWGPLCDSVWGSLEFSFLLCAIIYTLLSYFHRPDFCASQASSNFSMELPFCYVRILAVFSCFNLVDFSIAILVSLVLRPPSFCGLFQTAWLLHSHPGRGHVGRHLVANPGPGISTSWSHGPIWPFPSLILSRQFAWFSTISAFRPLV